MNDLVKIPPQAIDIENAILGTFLLERESWDKINRLNEDMFYKEQNRILFRTIKSLFDNQVEIDILTVTNKLRKDNNIELVSPVYLSELTKNIASARHLDYHILVFIEKYLKRLVIKQCNKISDDCYADEDMDDIFGKIETLHKTIIDEIDHDVVAFHINDTTTESKDLAYQRMIDLDKGKLAGIPINIGVLQQIIGGWQRGDLIYIAARPSMGKTAVACHFAKHSAKKGFKTLFFSLEMNKIALTDRMILSEADIEPDRWRNGQLTEKDFERMDDAQSIFMKYPLYINDKAKIRASDVEAVCKKMNPDIIFIDYIQLMRSARGIRYENRNLELGSISHDLKAIAKEYNIPVVCCAQLSRGVEIRGNKVPTLSDLRDSGELEQDADVIIFPVRPYVYSQDFNDKGKIDFYVAKHRNGKTGVTSARHNEFVNNFFDDIDDQDIQYQYKSDANAENIKLDF